MSRAQSFVWLLEECKGLDYQIEVYKRGKDFLAPKSLKEIHPLGKSPLVKIEAPSRPEPLIMAESGTITEYICDYFAPHLIPKRYLEGKEGQIGRETEQWLRYRHYMHYAEGSLMSLVLIAIFMDREYLGNAMRERICIAHQGLSQKSETHPFRSSSNPLSEPSRTVWRACS